MRKTNAYIPWLVFLAALAAITLALGFKSFIEYNRLLVCDFQTEWIVSSVERYIETTGGKLPSSWDEIAASLDAEIDSMGKCPWSLNELRNSISLNFNASVHDVLAGEDFISCNCASDGAISEANKRIRDSVELNPVEKGKAGESEGETER